MKVSRITVTFVAVVVLMATLALINNMRWSSVPRVEARAAGVGCRDR